MPTTSSLVTTRLPTQAVKTLEEIARERQRSPSAILREAFELYAEEWADYHIALDRLNDPGDPILTAEEFYGGLGREIPKP